MIVADPGHPGVLYGPSNDALWKSLDGGATWTRLSFTPTPIVALDASTGAIYASQGSQVVMSTDGFATTTPVGPHTASITSLAAAGGRVFVGAQLSSDVFAAKLDPDGNVLWATYLGGSSSDVARAMAVDAAGAVYLAGATQSTDYPVTPGAFATTGSSFVTKLNPDGAMAWSTYFAAQPNSIAVDAAGHVYIAGVVYLSGIPTTPGAYQTKFDGTFCGLGCLISIPPTNGFLTEFDAAGASLILSTYLGKQTESANAVGLFGDSSIVVAGQQGFYHFDPTGSSLLALKNFAVNVRSLAPDGAGNLLVTGSSTPFAGVPPFPSTPGVVQPSPYPVIGLLGATGNTGSGDGFVIRLDANLNVLTATLLGGEAPDATLSAAVAPDGSVIVGGSTYSKAFPTRGELQSSFSQQTGFLSTLSSDFSALRFSSFMGDSRNFYVGSVSVTPDGGIVFGGTTGSPPALGISPLGATPPDAFPNGGYQAFVVRVDPVKAVALRIDSVVNAASQLAAPLSPREAIQVHGAGFGDDVALLLNGSPLPLIAHDSATLTAEVPADFNGSASTMEVQSADARASVAVPGAAAAPAIFSRNGNGFGQGYILNKDGTPNSPGNPAAEGDEITIYVTGMGPMTFDHGYAVTDTPVVVAVDGFYANGIAAVLGPVDGLPGEVYQISVYVPRPSDFAGQNPNLKGFIMPPMVGVQISVGGATTQPGISMAVAH
jgi:uncharacterized protein (TIGR03437 family)